MKRIFAAVLLVSAIAPVAAQPKADPRSIVQDATERMLMLIERNLDAYRNDPSTFHSVVDSTLARHFDFERMSKLVLGTDAWREAEPPMRKEFIAEFRKLLVRIYGSVMLDYRGQAVSVPEVLDRYDARGELVTDPKVPDSQLRVVRVRTKIENSAASQGYYLVDYVFLRGDLGWGVIDVLIDGVSLVTTYSKTFRPIVDGDRGMRGVNEDLRRLNLAAARGASR